MTAAVGVLFLFLHSNKLSRSEPASPPAAEIESQIDSGDEQEQIIKIQDVSQFDQSDQFELPSPRRWSFAKFEDLVEKKDFISAVKYVTEFTPAGWKKGALIYLAEAWSDSNIDPKEISEALNLLPERALKELLLETIYAGLFGNGSKDNIPALLSNLETEGIYYSAPLLLEYLGSFELADVLELTTKLLPEGQDMWIEKLLEEHGDAALEQMLNWSLSGNESDHAHLTNRLLARWANADPANAASIIDSFSGTDIIEFNVKSRTAAELAKLDPVMALNWLNTAVESQIGFEVAARGIVAESALSDPEGTMNFVMEHVDDIFFQKPEDLMVSVLESWMEIDPTAAVERTLTLKDVNSVWFDEAAKVVSKSLFRTDVNQAAAFLSQLPEGAVRDNLIGEFAQSFEWEHPAIAVEWTLLITEEREQQRRLRNAFEAWMATNPEAAKLWAGNNGKDFLLE